MRLSGGEARGKKKSRCHGRPPSWKTRGRAGRIREAEPLAEGREDPEIKRFRGIKGCKGFKGEDGEPGETCAPQP